MEPSERPLAGRFVLLTRPADSGRRLPAALAALGATVDQRPTIAFASPADPQGARRALERIDSYDWLVFTSANGVRFFDDARRERGKLASFRGRVAAIGGATSDAAAAVGLTPEVVAEERLSEGLARAISACASADERVLLVRPEVSRDILAPRLREAGLQVDDVAFYRTAAAPGLDQLVADVGQRRYDAIVFTSASTFERLLGASADAGVDLTDALSEARLVAIGPVTAKAITSAGQRVRSIATEPSEQGLLAAIREALDDGSEG
jgi:uroporphyrinogen-III synthase